MIVESVLLLSFDLIDWYTSIDNKSWETFHIKLNLQKLYRHNVYPPHSRTHICRIIQRKQAKTTMSGVTI